MAASWARRTLALLAALVLLAACTADAHPIVKLGVIAPFEGQGRPLGYAVLPAVKQVAAEANARGDFGDYRVLVVAFSDDLDPGRAAEQARALALDGDVMAVTGPFTRATAAAAVPVLAEAGIPYLALDSAAPAGSNHAADEEQARKAATALLQALAADIVKHGEPSRAGVAAELALR